MRKAKRRWLWLLVPLVGIGATRALPPLDEYAPLDRIGTRYDPAEDGMLPISPDDPASFRADVRRMNDESLRLAHELDDRMGVARRRGWRIHVPEAEARRAFGRLFSMRGGWRNVGNLKASTSAGKRRSSRVLENRVNDETGDHASVAFETLVAPTRGPTWIKVMVSQSKASLRPRALARRWWRGLVRPTR